jgi:6-phosphogluconate dehydrogenase
MNKTIHLFGLGIMGRNLARNFADKGYTILGYDPDERARGKLRVSKRLHIIQDWKESIRSTADPQRVILLMLPAGNLIDEQLNQLYPLLAPNDIIIDGGNSHYADTENRQRKAAQSQVHLLSLGISGGHRGARSGPALMLSGNEHAVQTITPLLSPIAASGRDGEPCLVFTGKGGSGHFVKTIHNGIEYAMMQLISEAYYLLKKRGGLCHLEIRDIFDVWNTGPLSSYLLEISSTLLGEYDQQTDTPLLELIIDSASENGTGKWAAMAALKYGVPAPTITQAVSSRSLSSLLSERAQLAKLYPPQMQDASVPLPTLRSDIGHALHAAIICSYAQGFALLSSASHQETWGLNLKSIAESWSNGCILRSKLLLNVADALDVPLPPSNLLLDTSLAKTIAPTLKGLRNTVSDAVLTGCPVPGFSSALSYFDSYTAGRLWTDLIQGQRDYFGHHGFRRADKEGLHHGSWSPPE